MEFMIFQVRQNYENIKMEKLEIIKIKGDMNMEKKALLLFSHQLTENQAKELMEDFGVKKIVSLTSELQEMWSNVSIKENYMENLEN